MPKKTVQILNQEFYHIIKRGIKPQKTFLDQEDHLRCINSFLVFNDKEPAPWQSRGFWQKYNQPPEFLTQTDYTPRKPLVEIHAFALMPNHFHLLVRQLVENGVQIFMQKLGGYSQYFNQKYDREGSLFPDRYKIVHIGDEGQLKNTFIYICTNPLALIEFGWKDWKVKNPSKAIKFLEEKYRWSSNWDYFGRKNFPQITTREFFLELLGGGQGVRKEILSWIEFKNEIFKDEEKLKKLQQITLE